MYQHQIQNLKQILLLFFALLITIVIYSKSIDGFFIFDDLLNLEPTFLDKLSLENLTYVVTQNSSGIHPLSRAIPSISFYFTHLLHGDIPWGFRYHNILLHLIIGLSCFFFVHKLINSTQEKANFFIPTLVSALWLLHPLHVSTTLYSIQRIAQFSTLFILLALIVYITAINASNTRRKLFFYLFLYPLACLCGLMSKENIAVICFCIIPVFYIIKNADFIKISKLDTLFIWLYGWLATLIIFMTIIFNPDRFINYANRNFTLVERLYTQVDVLILYGQQIFYPKLSKMGLFLDDIPIISEFSGILFLKLLLITSLIVVLIYAIIRGKVYGIGILFFLGHTVESTVISLEIAFEHRNYFPSVGFLIILAIALDKLRNHTYRNLLSFLVLLYFSALLNLRVGFWENEHEWVQTSFAYHPNSFRTNNYYANYLFKHGFKEEGIKHLNIAQSKFPSSTTLQISELIALECGNDKENNQIAINQTLENRTEIFNAIKLILKNRKVTLQDYNALATIVDNKGEGICKFLELNFLNELVDFVYKKSLDTKSTFTPYLNGLRGKISSLMGLKEEAAKIYKTVYDNSNDVRFLFAHIELLISEKNTYDQGVILLQEIIDNKYFNSKLYKKQINTIANKAVFFKNANKAIDQ